MGDSDSCRSLAPGKSRRLPVYHVDGVIWGHRQPLESWWCVSWLHHPVPSWGCPGEDADLQRSKLGPEDSQYMGEESHSYRRETWGLLLTPNPVLYHRGRLGIYFSCTGHQALKRVRACVPKSSKKRMYVVNKMTQDRHREHRRTVAGVSWCSGLDIRNTELPATPSRRKDHWGVCVTWHCWHVQEMLPTALGHEIGSGIKGHLFSETLNTLAALQCLCLATCPVHSILQNYIHEWDFIPSHRLT